MKLIAFLLSSFLLSSFNTAKCQVNNNTTVYVQEFTFDAVKDYNNNRRVAYYTIVGIESNEEGQFIQTKLRENNNVSRFFVYDGKNGKSKCMIETVSTMNETALHLLINDAISQYRETTLQNEQAQ